MQSRDVNFATVLGEREGALLHSCVVLTADHSISSFFEKPKNGKLVETQGPSNSLSPLNTFLFNNNEVMGDAAGAGLRFGLSR
jgi:hypothetical protein